jgi:hypothetical protein
MALQNNDPRLAGLLADKKETFGNV